MRVIYIHNKHVCVCVCLSLSLSLRQVDGDLSVLKAGAKVLLMGTASELPPPPKEKIKFVEDLTKAEKALLMPVRAHMHVLCCECVNVFMCSRRRDSSCVAPC